MDSFPKDPVADLDWSHVGFGLTFIVFNSVVSQVLQLHLGTSLVVASLRCVVQLTLVATILQQVFAAKNIWAIAGIACKYAIVAFLAGVLLNLIGTFEVVVIKAKRRCKDMFRVVFVAMVASTIPVTILGLQFSMRVFPFWTPMQFIPIVGMQCGNSIAGVLVLLSFLLKELDENRDKTETLLAFGASRFEACRPLAIESLRLALMPTINQMSVIGIISIPGTMTGAILGGADVAQAARLQMIIMFMLSASSALSCIIVALFTLYICVDSEHRIRSDRIYARHHPFRRAGSHAARVAVGSMRRVWVVLTGFVKQLLLQGAVVSNGNDGDSRSERAPLLP